MWEKNCNFAEMNYTDLLEKAEATAMEGKGVEIAELLSLAGEAGRDDEALQQLCDAAFRVQRRWTPKRVETCSIVNARSGRCSEDCKWCAQAADYSTGCQQYLFVPEKEWVKAALTSRAHGVDRISMVTSGRKVGRGDITKFCSMFRKAPGGIGLCASMGLLGIEEMIELKEAGVTRYHCNLETSARYFPTLCTTHTRRDKLDTISAARAAGLEVCSGGIIGMGETLRDRLEMVKEAVEAGAASVPVNLLCPIPGTPLGDTPLLPEREVVLTAALMRFVAPKVTLRFAGGRRRLSQQATERMLRGGINGAMMGDLLTTEGNDAREDRALFDRVAQTVPR